MVRGSLAFTTILFVISILFMIATMSYPHKAKLFPLLTLLVALILLIIQIIREVLPLKGVEALRKGKTESFNRRHLAIGAWLLGTVVMLWVLGFMGTVILLPFLYLRFQKESWLLSILLSLGGGFFFYGLFGWGLNMSLYPGVLFPKIFG
jgi:hypothetical protein